MAADGGQALDEETIPPLNDGTDFTGEVLTRIRERKGKTLKEISEITRIGTATLSAVEGERFEELPGARIYVRGFLRCLAKELELDPDVVSKSYLVRWQRWFDQKAEK